jgi:hypothetical protein
MIIQQELNCIHCHQLFPPSKMSSCVGVSDKKKLENNVLYDSSLRDFPDIKSANFPVSTSEAH